MTALEVSLNNTKPECPICKNTYRVEKNIDGRFFAQRCSCFIQVLRENYIPERFMKEFKEDHYPEPYQLKALQKYLIWPEKQTLLLWGPPGVGKTHLAWSVFEIFGILTYFKNMSQINSRDLGKILRLRTVAFSTIEEENEAKYQKLIDSKFVFIDEFWVDETVRTPEFCSWFSMFFDSLKESCKLVITMNYNPQAINLVDGALYSRLVDREKSVIMKMEGKNWRLQ